MKKIKIFSIITIAAILGFSACTKDFLELTPKVGQLEGNFYKTEKDAFLALTAVYDAMSLQNWAFIPLMADIRSADGFAGGDNSGNDMLQWQQEEKFEMDGENNSAKDLWARCYAGIYRANLLLEKVDGIAWTNESNKKRIVAEAKFLRAYFYWDLERHYGWVPILTKVESNPENLNKLPQSTPEQVYQFIMQDLQDAIVDLPANVTVTETGRASKHVAKALTARIYMYYQGFAVPVLKCPAQLTDGSTEITKAKVIGYLEDIISSGTFSLQSSYADVFDWANENNNEMIFCYQYDSQSGATDWGGWGINGNFSVIFQGPRDPKGDDEVVAGWSFNPLTFSLVNAFETGDSRKATVVYDANQKLTKYTKGFENTGYFNYKFIPRKAYQSTKGDPSHNYPINYPDIRYADVLLMSAELNLTENTTKALEYFNMVRKRAMGNAAALSSLTLADIQHERRVELAGEGHRYWDELRWGLDFAEAEINGSFQNIPTNIANVNPADFTGRTFKRNTYGMFPIPASEIRNTNGNLKNYIPAYAGF